MKRTSALLSAVLVLAGASIAQAETAMTNEAGMTLYVFDNDTGGVSACYDNCATNWPPYLGNAGDEKGEGWTLVERTDGTLQWAYDGKPTYLFHEDMAAGEMKGDGRGGVWHVLME